jgi:hypothetical protein
VLWEAMSRKVHLLRRSFSIVLTTGRLVFFDREAYTDWAINACA